MNEPTADATPEPIEDFATVLARARAKARGVPYDPAADGAHQPSRAIQQNDQALAGLVERFMARAAKMPRDLPPEEPKAPAPSATDVRLGWYIPKRHWGDTLENFVCHTVSQKVALDATREWIQSVRRGDGGALALVGEVGSGKSHLLYAAIRELNTAGVHAAAGGWYDLADLFRQAKFGHDEDVTDSRIKKGRILGASALGIDEIRPTSGTEYDTTELSQLMTRAYRECQGIFVTSNHADDKLSKIVGLAATSRLTQVTVMGPDLRQPENRHLRAVR